MTPARDLAERFHHRWLEVHPFAATMYGVPGFDHLVPDDSEAGDEQWADEVGRFVAEADAVQSGDRDMDADDLITLGCLRAAGDQEVAAVESAAVEYTVTAMPFADPASFLAVAARTVLTDAEAADAYVTRLQASGEWIDRLTARVRRGAGRGRFPVAPLVEQAIGWADSVLAADEPAALMAPAPPEGWDESAGWEERRRAAAADVVKPALARWRDLLQQILPDARDSDHGGLCHLPDGVEDYARAIRTHTTLPLTAEQLHDIGMREIAVLEERAVRLGEDLGLNSLEEVLEALRNSAGRVPADESVAQAVDAIRRAEAETPSFFPPPLPAPCAVTPMPFVVASAGTAPHYTPPRLDGGRPGTFWFNTERPTAGTGWDLEVVAFHEAVPGHHLQLSRVQLLDALPALQRQRSFTVFSEGWGLYAEQLAEEAGLYSGTEALLGAISASLMRAARLVLDTGLHAFGWSREKALEFYIAHAPFPPEFLTAEVDRYLVMPGQALAYLTGKLEILQLRAEAERRLGGRFSLPEFHAAVLDRGSLPMPVLAQSIDSWLADSVPA